MNEIENAKPIAKLLEAVRAVMNRDVQLGLYQPDTLRLTVESRKRIAVAMIEGGVSEREAAKALGVSKTAIRNDIGKDGSGHKVTKNGQKVTTTNEDDDDPDLPDQKILRVCASAEATRGRLSPSPSAVAA